MKTYADPARVGLPLHKQTFHDEPVPTLESPRSDLSGASWTDLPSHRARLHLKNRSKDDRIGTKELSVRPKFGPLSTTLLSSLEQSVNQSTESITTSLSHPLLAAIRDIWPPQTSDKREVCHRPTTEHLYDLQKIPQNHQIIWPIVAGPPSTVLRRKHQQSTKLNKMD